MAHPKLKKAYQKLDRFIWRSYITAQRGYRFRNRQLEERIRKITLASEKLNRKTCGMEQFLGFDIVGDAIVIDGVSSYVYPLRPHTNDEAYQLVTALHTTGEPFRIMVILRNSGGGEVAALSKQLQESETVMRARYEQQMPGAKQPWDWWKTQYMEYLTKLAQTRKTVETYLVLPVGVSVPMLDTTRRLNGPALHRLAVLILGMPWDQYEIARERLRTEQDYIARVREERGVTPGLSIPEASVDLPQEAAITQSGVRITSGSQTWHFGGMTFHKIHPLDELVQMVMPAVDADTTLHFMLTALPVRQEDTDGFVGIARKKAINEQRERTPREGEIPDVVREYLKDLWAMIDGVSVEGRQGFECRLDLSIRTKTAERLNYLLQAIVRLMSSDSKIFVERPKHWLQTAEILQNTVPGLSVRNVRAAGNPVTDLRLLHAVTGKRRSSSSKWLAIGKLLPDGRSFQLGPGVHIGIGEMASGKSMMAKFAAAHLMATAVLPPHIYVYDGAGYLPDDGETQQRAPEEQLKGWYDFMAALGLTGAVVFADCFKTEKDLRAKLNTLAGSPVVLYYPDQDKPEYDLVYFKWILRMLRQHARPRETDEQVIGGLVVIDDALSLIGDVSVKSRLQYLAAEVLPQTVANNFAAILTLQTPEAIHTAESTAFAILKGITNTWCVFSLAAFWTIAQEIGIAEYIPAGGALTQQIITSMQAVVPAGSTGVTTTPGFGVAVFRTVDMSLFQTLASGELINLLQRKNGGASDAAVS